MSNLRKIFILIIIMVLILPIEAYAENNTNKIYTRENLQKYVVSTAMSYYYNNKYSDYEQYAMDEKLDYPYDFSSFNWRDFSKSPEMISRSNFLAIDCSSFAAVTYLYSIGFDFSDYYNYSYTDSNNNEHYLNFYYDYNKKKTNESKNNFERAYLEFGRGETTSNFSTLAYYETKDNNTNGWNNDNNSEFVYRYKTKINYYNETDDENIETNEVELEEDELINNNSEVSSECNVTDYRETCDEQQQIKDDIINNLLPGDLIVYRKIIKNEGKIYKDNEQKGHVIIYVGDVFNTGEHGFIHSTGYAFKKKNDGTITLGDDKYSIRYDSWENIFKNQLFSNEQETATYSISIIRPINKYCANGDNNCKINNDTIKSQMFKNNIDFYLNNTITRNELSNLRIEQYQFRNEKENILSKYNSVNIGDEISYRMALTNKSNFGYCTDGKYATNTECTSNGFEWLETNRTSVKYDNLTVTGKIPDGTEFISCEQSERFNECEYNPETRTVTWKYVSIPANDTAYQLTYKVKAFENNKIINEGMKIENENNNTLKMGKMETLVADTINDSKKIELFQNSVNSLKENMKTYNNNFDFIKDIYLHSLGINLSHLNYDNIKNAIFKLNDLDSTKNVYIRRTDNYEDADENNINSILVPGLYGGTKLKGNGSGDRARIINKNGYNTSLEVGDIIITYDFENNDNKAWLFYGYTEDDKLMLVECNDNNLIFHTPQTSDTKTGFRIFKEIYSYDLFAILRPTLLYKPSVGKEEEEIDDNKSTGDNIIPIIIFLGLSSVSIYTLNRRKIKNISI